MDDLLDGLDNIPEIMKQIQGSPTRGRRKVRTTQSFNVTAALNPENENIVAEKFALQADKVLQHLSDLRSSRAKKTRSVAELASEALPQFDQLLEKAGDADVFRQYDVLRRGKITYDDFHDIVVSCNTGFTKKECYALAHELDKGKTGLIKYNQIVDTLKDIDAKMAVEKHVSQNQAANEPPSPPARSDRPDRERRAAAVPRPDSSIPAGRKYFGADGNAPIALAAAGAMPPAPGDVPLLPSEIIRVSDLSPSYSSPIKKKQTAAEQQDNQKLKIGSYNPKYFGSNMHGLLRHDEMKKPRSSSAPPLRLQGPATAEGAIAKEYSRRNQSTHRVIQKHDYGSKKVALSKAAAEKLKSEFKPEAVPAEKDVTEKSLLKYLKQKESGQRRPPEAKANTKSSTKEDLQNFNSKEFFSASERQKREAGRARQQAEEAKDLESRATKVRVNSIITQTQGNIKPLQFQLMKRDRSRSGTVTRSEFDNTLHYLGIVMPKADTDALFQAHSHTVQSTQKYAASIDYKEPVLHIDSFIQGLRMRGSAPIFAHLADENSDAVLPKTKYGHAVHHGNQRRHDSSKSNAESKELKSSTIATLPESNYVTPMQRERARIIRKVMESNSDPSCSKSRAEFLKGASLNGGSVKAEALIEQINRDGANITPAEYELLITPLHTGPDGSINVADFSNMMTTEGVDHHNYGDLGRLSIGLSVTNQNDPFKYREPCQSNVSNVTHSAETSRFKREEGLLGRKYLGSTQHALFNYASGFARDKLDRKELNKDRVAWSKVVTAIRSSKGNIEKILNGTMGRERGDPVVDFAAPLSQQQLARALSTAGVRLSTSDLALLQAHCNAVESKTGRTELSLEAVCKSLGMNTADDPKRGKVIVVPDADILDELGIYGASHSSIMANPTFRSSIFDAPDVADKSWSNRRRHYGQRNASSASNFWNLTHTASMDLMPSGSARNTFRGSMVSDHGSWNGVWPPNKTDAAHKAASNATLDEMRRDMFSPYGRGSKYDNPRASAGASRKRSGSAPPALSRKSLSEFVGGESEPSRDPYKTPVAQRTQEETRAAAPEAAPAPAPVFAAARPAAAPQESRAIERAPAADVRDVSAAVSRWANRSLAELMAGKGIAPSLPAAAASGNPE